MEKPGVLHILSQIPAHTGSGIFLTNLMRQFHARGYRQGVVLGLPQSLSGYTFQDMPDVVVYEVLFETRDYPYKIPGMSDVMPYESSVFSTLTPDEITMYFGHFKQGILRAVEEIKPSFILSNHLWAATAAAVEAVEGIVEGKRPQIYGICHGTDIRQMQLAPNFKNRVLNGCRQLDAALCLSNEQAVWVNKAYGLHEKHIKVIGTGYDNHTFCESHLEKASISSPVQLVYAGKLSNSKGVVELLKAFKGIAHKGFSLSLAGGGTGEEAETIMSAIEATVGADYVGRLSQQELAALFNRASILVLPSFYEGLPLVVIEALACGMKVVVNELSGLREWLGDTINNSGRITYVEMPRIIEPDICMPDDEEAYVWRLANAIEQSAACDGDVTPAFREDIVSRSWSGVFNNVMHLIKKTDSW